MAKLTPLQQIEKRISEAYVELSDLDSLILKESSLEKQARVDSIANIGRADYKFGTGAAAHRQKTKKGLDDREILLAELDALAVAKSAASQGEAQRVLDAAVKDLRPHRKNLESQYREAGELLEKVAAIWLKVKDELEAFDQKAHAGSNLARAVISNPNAGNAWNEVVGSLGDLGPAPANLGYFVETVLAAGIDPNRDDDYGSRNTMRTTVGVPDLRPYNVVANWSGDRLVKRGGSDFGDWVGALAARNAPKVEFVPTSVNPAVAAELAARAEREFQARKSHDIAKRGYDDTPAKWTVAPVIAADPDFNPNDVDGLGHSVAQLEALARA